MKAGGRRMVKRLTGSKGFRKNFVFRTSPSFGGTGATIGRRRASLMAVPGAVSC